MGTDKSFFKNYDFSRVFLNLFITFTVSIYLSFFALSIFQDVNWLIFLIIFLIIAFLLTLFPFKKKFLYYFVLILLLIPILSLFISFLIPPSAPPPSDPPKLVTSGCLDIIPSLIIIILFISVSILLILRKTKRPEKEIIAPLKPDLLRSIFFLIYTSIGWTLFSYLLEMDSQFAGIAAIIAGLIVAGFDPDEIIAITKKI